MSTDECCTSPGEPERANDVGLSSLRYRVGTWSTFRERMVRQLSRQPHSPFDASADADRPLAKLTTREAHDETIGLIDAWACVCDVLTFYGERILNEGYLRTATETRSVTEIARGIGYRPDPGVAAATALAFTISDQVDDEVWIPLGQPVMSVPAPEELPQTFETIDELQARREWNTMRPRRTVPHTIANGTTTLYLDGANTGLKVGDPVVVLGQLRDATPGADTTERWDLRFVVAVNSFGESDTYANKAHSMVTLQDGLGDQHTNPASTEVQVFTLGKRAGLFGWNAPDARIMSAEIKGNKDLISNNQWKNFGELKDDQTRKQIDSKAIDLDMEYPGIVAGSWICLHEPREVELYRVAKTNPASRTEFSMSTRLTRVFIDSDEHLDIFRRRSTTVLCESRALPISERPDDSAVSGYDVELDQVLPAMAPGRRVIVTGELASTGERVVTETTVSSWSDGAQRSTVSLTTLLPAMRRASVQVLGNVALSTHGATVANEVLGHGDAGSANQQMALRNAPLTWTPAAPTGSDSSLIVRVAGVEWSQVDTFFDQGPTDRVFTAQRLVTDALDADELDLTRDITVVHFGDGKRGARPPTGTDNVLATYRKGLGVAGNLAAEQLTLLQQRPAAVRGVVNPSAALGGNDPAKLSEIRKLAPLDVLTLGRLVALQDYDDHAGTFPGVGKARAVDLWDGHRSFIHVTIAGPNGTALDDTSYAATTLVESVDALKDPGHRVVVSGHDAKYFAAILRLRVAAGALFSDVKSRVATAIETEFGFDNRQFGQPALAAELMAVAHAVPHVVAIDIDYFHRLDHPLSLADALPAAVAKWDGTTVTRAELLLIDPGSLSISPLEDT